MINPDYKNKKNILFKFRLSFTIYNDLNIKEQQRKEKAYEIFSDTCL